ncbi:MAG TPA: patatin-like phospholipase family protein [Synergistales bacterium]|nr:patatin-like phospholipase family protein [Synergistales bacterium]HRV71868.1 patatin-like phospholipase family protein [Thermovirgaceae bacterium]
MPRVGLALGGGGARGAAHFGVLKVLEEEGVPIDIIAGTSMGAIVGGMYAQNPDAGEIIKKYLSFLESMDYESLGLQNIVPQDEEEPHLLQKFAKTIARRVYISSMGSRSGIMKPDILEDALKTLLDRGSVRDAKIPFGAVATDLNSGNTLLLREGSLRKAVKRSALIPGFLPPEEDGTRLITDGGVSDPIPVRSARDMGADMVIAVSVDPTTMASIEDPNMINIMRRCDLIRGIYMSRIQMEMADVCIWPDMSGAHWSEFLSSEEFIQAGEAETRKKLPDIKKAIRRKRHWIFRFLPM